MRANPKSTPPPSTRKLSKEEAKQAILGMADISQRPLLVGVVAVRLGVLWSMGETESLFAELVTEQLLRPLSEKERGSYGLQEGYLPAWCK